MKPTFTRLNHGMISTKGEAKPTSEVKQSQQEPDKPAQNQNRISITLKLNEKPYLRMKTYGAQNRMTNQEILEIALDDFLDKRSA